MKKVSFLYPFCTAVLILATLLMPLASPANAASAASHPVYLPIISNSNGLGDLGTIKYTLDSVHQSSGDFTDDGHPLQLSVTDANGVIWTLSVPADALLVPVTISMTPFSAIDATQARFAPTSGVEFQPDGLQFTAAATLTATYPPAAPAGFGVLYNLKQDGSFLQFAANTSSGKTATSLIWHFSGAASNWVDPDSPADMQRYQQYASNEYNAAWDLANQFIHQGAPMPPIPPRVSMYCLGTPANPDATLDTDEFVADFYKPYGDIINTLLGASRLLGLVANGGFDTSTAIAKAATIAQIALNNALLLGNQYKNEKPPDHLYPLILNGLAVFRNYELLSNSSIPVDDNIINWQYGDLSVWLHVYSRSPGTQRV